MYYYGYYNPHYSVYYGPHGYPNPSPAYSCPYPPASSVVSPPAYPQSGYPAQSGYPGQSDTRGSQDSRDTWKLVIGRRIGPSDANTGGVSFEITPGTAEVFIDGQYVGTVDQFTPTSQPLGLTPGRHQIEIRAAGYRTIDFDADIVAGQVIPYQGALER